MDHRSAPPSTPLIYLDNAATSWPKPLVVKEAMCRFMDESGGNPGRAGHRLSIAAGRVVEGAREAIATLFGCEDPLRVVFGLNVTEALNLALCGLLRPGDHVITTSMEHNAMMRPLRALEKQGVALTCVPCSPEGLLDPQDVKRSLRPETRLVAMIHASNVSGTLLPIGEVGLIAREQSIAFLVDVASTAGVVPIDMERDNIDLLAFTGHKGLLGPMGTGGLVLSDRIDENRIAPLKRGGTGSRSTSEEQPVFLPDRFESGTPNALGLAGLEASVHWILDQGVSHIRRTLATQFDRLMAGLAAVPGLRFHGPQGNTPRTATLSFTLESASPSEIGAILDEEYGILSRVGLHCSPAAHRTLGTFPQGTVRFSPGLFTREEDVDAIVAALDAIARRSA